MAAWLSFFGTILLASGAVQQLVALILYRHVVKRARQFPFQDDTFQPEVLVVLPVRGLDSCLPATLDALALQEYPNWSLRVIVDSRQDPAWPVVQKFGNTTGIRIEIQELNGQQIGCSRKCAAILQATESLPENCEAVAFIDSDIIPATDWLSRLIRPLSETTIGIVTGNRWYIPHDTRWGSWLRYVWNTGAVVAMVIRAVPWGGSLAIRSAMMTNPELREKLACAGCEDMPLSKFVRSQKLKIHFNGALLPDAEGCDFREYRRFVFRQMTWVRLYRPLQYFLPMLLYLSISLGIWLMLIAGIIAGVNSDWPTLGFIAIVGSSYCGFTWMMVAHLEHVSGKLLPPQTIAPKAVRRWKAPLASIASLFLLPDLFLNSVWPIRVSWRGITYRIRGPYNIQPEAD